MPVLNDTRIGRAIDSVTAQSNFDDVQLIVIDGGSDEPTLREIRLREEAIDVFISEPDNGIYDAMNKGISQTTGEVVGILNADDKYIHSGVLTTVATTFEASSLDGCYANLTYRNLSKYVHRVWKSGRSNTLKWRLGWMPPHPTLFLRKPVYDRFGRFDVSFHIASDYELMLRLFVKEKIKTKHIVDNFVVVAPGGASTRNIQTVVSANIEILRAWRMNNLTGGWLVPILKPIRKLFQLRLGTISDDV